MGENEILIPDGHKAPPEKLSSERSHEERFDDAKKFVAFKMNDIFEYNLKPSLNGKKSPGDVLADSTLFDREKIAQDLRFYIEDEWKGDESELPDECKPKIEQLIKNLIDQLESRVRNYISEKNSKVTLQSRVNEELDRQMRFF